MRSGKPSNSCFDPYSKKGSVQDTENKKMFCGQRKKNVLPYGGGTPTKHGGGQPGPKDHITELKLEMHGGKRKKPGGRTNVYLGGGGRERKHQKGARLLQSGFSQERTQAFKEVVFAKGKGLFTAPGEGPKQAGKTTKE